MKSLLKSDSLEDPEACRRGQSLRRIGHVEACSSGNATQGLGSRWQVGDVRLLGIVSPMGFHYGLVPAADAGQAQQTGISQSTMTM